MTLRDLCTGLAALLTAMALPVAPAQSADAGAATAPSWVADPPPKLPGSMWPTLHRYRDFVGCMAAASNWPTAKLVFETRIGSAEQNKILKRLTGGNLGTNCSYVLLMKMDSMMMRGGIAEARYLRVYANEPPPAANGELAPVPAGASYQWVKFNMESPDQRLHDFATCLVQKEAGAVYPVLTTRPGSKEERAAMQALSRRFGTCLSTGERLRANSLTLRPWLGEAIYQQARRARPDA